MIHKLKTLTLFWGLYCTLDEYLEQRERLQKPSEQERLLRETPRIIEDLIEVKRESAASSESSKQGNMSGMSQEAAIEID